MQKIQIKWFEDKDQLAKKGIGQIYSKGLEFAIATSKEQCSHFIYCKDFLHDVVWANLYDKAVEIYSFRYDPKVSPIDVNGLTRTLIANESDEFFDKKIPNCLEFLNKVEAHLHLRRTVGYQCENPPETYLPGGVFLLEGSQRWMSSPPLLSMYTMFIRCGFVHKMGDDYMDTLNKIVSGETPAYQDNDKQFIKDALPGIKAILALGYRKIFHVDIEKNYPRNISTDTLHHRCGIRAYSWGQTTEIVPYWHREDLLTMLREREIEIKYLWTCPPENSEMPPPLISSNSSTNAIWDFPIESVTKNPMISKNIKKNPWISKNAKSELHVEDCVEDCVEECAEL